MKDACKNPDFSSYIEVQEENHKTKIKWLGDNLLLKDFVEKELKLSGSWSFLLCNAGYHLFKSSVLTLNFYPTTKTLHLQGPKQDSIKRQIVSLSRSTSQELHANVEETSTQLDQEDPSSQLNEESSQRHNNDENFESDTGNNYDSESQNATDSDCVITAEITAECKCNCSELLHSLKGHIMSLETKRDSLSYENI